MDTVSPANQVLESSRPPLANELFEDRDAFSKITRMFPDCQPIIPFVRDVKSVEQVLEELQSQVKENPRRAVQLAAIRHYLQFIILECEAAWQHVHKGVTNYATLLDEIESWRYRRNEPVCLVTFNYDTMIEQALPSVGVKIAEMNDYISQPYILIKLHGSVNWGREVGNVHVDMNDGPWGVAKRIIEAAPHLVPINRFHIVRDRPIGQSAGGPLIPALAIPLVQKQEYECPKEHVDALDRYLPDVTKLLVVGWRANEQHFLQRLAGGLKKPLHVMIVSRSEQDVEETINNLANARMQVIGGFKRAKKGFSEFIIKRRVQELLTT